MNSREIAEARFAYQIKAALNESAARISTETAGKLSDARKIALQNKKAESFALAPQLALAGSGSLSSTTPSTPNKLERGISKLRHLGLLWPLIVLVVGLIGIAQWQQQKRIEELADIDAAMLVDDLPPSAYADQGFSAFLKHGQ